MASATPTSNTNTDQEAFQHIGAWVTDVPQPKTAISDAIRIPETGNPVSSLITEHNTGTSPMMQTFLNDFTNDQPWTLGTRDRN
ncbi:hypothetical protein AWENTII_012418 [Aspergillus wentii]